MGLLVACGIGGYSLYDISDERKKYETKINLIPYMKTILLLLIIIFAAYDNVSAAPAQAVVKLVKNISKTTKKVPARKPLKRIPAKTGSSMNVPDLPSKGCIGCWWTGKINCNRCSGKGTVPGVLWGSNQCPSCSGTGKIRHLCNK